MSMALQVEDYGAAGLVGIGLAGAVVGMLLRLQKREKFLAELLELDGGAEDVPVEAVTETPVTPAVTRVTARLGDIFGRLDTRGSVGRMLVNAEIPLRPGEYLFLSGLAAVVCAAVIGLLAKSPFGAVAVVALVGGGAFYYPKRKAHGRREKMRGQLPNAFSLIASSVSAGHTFLRSIQLLREQIAAPLAGELDRVVAEVMLGSNLIDALERFADRSQIMELRWAVHAVRIQQSTGGQLSELLHTLADFMRAREEVHREVLVLTAEGRFSGYVLIALPILVTGALVVLQPHYLAPMLRGWGIVWLSVAAGMLLVGYAIIRKMVDIEV
jgi:tight adherence protein B